MVDHLPAIVDKKVVGANQGRKEGVSGKYARLAVEKAHSLRLRRHLPGQMAEAQANKGKPKDNAKVHHTTAKLSKD
ncbi:MAG: hypothetical protein AAFN68_08415 [Pseudomonadota bacterium]